jgi:ribA/ribD-fused uncharacterized protein
MTKQYKFFWGKEDVESNFYPIDYFGSDNILYNCSEQQYMYKKAMYFLDKDMAEKILKLTDPKHIKAAGKLVRGFDEQIWDRVCVDKMLETVRDKFNNSRLKVYLLECENATFVEASPYDRKWGIGLSKFEALRVEPKLWPGENLLGKVLNFVQCELQFRESVKWR